MDGDEVLLNSYSHSNNYDLKLPDFFCYLGSTNREPDRFADFLYKRS